MTSLLGTALKETEDMVSVYRKAASQSLPNVNQALTTRTGMSSSNYSSESSERYQYFRHWVFICTNAIASAVAGLPWKAAEITNATENPERQFGGWQEKVPLRVLEKVTSTQEMVALGEHPSIDLLAQPNEHQAKYEFIYFTVANLEIIGAAYWILGTDDEGNDPRIFTVPATWMKYDRDKDVYLLRVKGSNEPLSIPSEYVAKMCFPNPSDPLGFYSPLNACISAIRVDDYIQRSQHMAFDRGIFPNLILTVGKLPGQQDKPSLTGFQRRQLVRAVREIWSNTVNVGDPAIVDGLIESVHKLQSTPQEMDWQASGEVVKKRIMQTYRVNPYIVGDVTGMNKAQAIVAQSVFNEQVVNPLAGALSNAMTYLLGPRYDSPKRLVLYLEEAKAVDREQRLREWSTLRRSDDVTQNEYRAAILGLPPLEERDDGSGLLSLVGGLNGITTLLQQVSMGLLTTEQAIRVLTTILRLPEDEARAIVGSTGAIRIPDETPPVRSKAKTTTKDKSAIKARHAKRQQTAETELDKALREFLSDTYNGWVKQIENSGFTPNADESEEQAKKVMSKVYNANEFYKEMWEAILVPQLLEFLSGAQDEWDNNEDLRKKSHIKTTTAEDIADELGIDVEEILEDFGMFDIALELPEFMLVEALKAVAESAAQPYWAAIGDTFTMRVQSKLTIAIKEGLSIPDIAKSLLRDADTPDSTWIKARAKNIARTEVGNMQNAGHDASRRQLAEDSGMDLRNSWLSVLGSTTREAHANLDGELADEDGMFNLNGVMIPWPSHISLPPGDRCNCQCGITTEPFMG